MIVSSQYEVHLKQSFLKIVFCINSKSPHGWVFMLVFTSGTFSARRMSLGVLIWVNAITYSHPALHNCSYIRQRFYVWDQKLMYEKRTNEFIGIFNCSRLSKDLKWSDMKYSRSLCVKKNVKPERSCCFSCWLVSKTRWLFVKLFTPLGGFGQRPHTTLILFNKRKFVGWRETCLHPASVTNIFN